MYVEDSSGVFLQKSTISTYQGMDCQIKKAKSSSCVSSTRMRLKKNSLNLKIVVKALAENLVADISYDDIHYEVPSGPVYC